MNDEIRKIGLLQQARILGEGRATEDEKRFFDLLTHDTHDLPHLPDEDKEIQIDALAKLKFDWGKREPWPKFEDEP